MNVVLFALLVSLGINLAMFVIAFIKQTDTLTDISYAVTFAVVTVGTFLVSDKSPLQSLALSVVLLWALRIGSFLFLRIRRIKTDSRFDGMRENFWKFIRFWILQGLTVFLVLLSTVLLMRVDAPGINLLSVIGFLVALFGLIIETIADRQKSKFSADKQNKSKWIDAGLWRSSRHPNYLGEITFWVGIYLATASALNGIDIAIGLVSPIYIASLIIFISGIPLLEKSADNKWGSLETYKKYKNEVPVLLPTLKSLGRLSAEGK